MRRIDARVDDADADLLRTGLLAIGALRGRADHLHVPLGPRERVLLRRGGRHAGAAALARALDAPLRLPGTRLRRVADRLVGGGADELALARRVGREVAVGRADRGD